MRFKKIFIAFCVLVCFSSCKVTFITGYDSNIDQTATDLKKDFNFFFLRLSRTLCDGDTTTQNIKNFQGYYDSMEVNLRMIKDREVFLGKKSSTVINQINNVDSVMHAFKRKHAQGFTEIDCNSKFPQDDKHDLSNDVNISLDGLLKLQEELKSTGTITSSSKNN